MFVIGNIVYKNIFQLHYAVHVYDITHQMTHLHHMPFRLYTVTDTKALLNRQATPSPLVPPPRLHDKSVFRHTKLSELKSVEFINLIFSFVNGMNCNFFSLYIIHR